METVLGELADIKEMLVAISNRLTEIEATLDEYKPKPVNIQKDVEVQTALKGILHATRKL
jgi:hypothetical protein